MTEALQLFDTAPALTDRQQFALELVERAREEGVDADWIGAALHWRRGKHPQDSRCMFCGKDGRGVLEELARKGLVRYRRRTARLDGAWLRVGAAARPVRGMLADDEAIPF